MASYISRLIVVIFHKMKQRTLPACYRYSPPRGRCPRKARTKVSDTHVMDCIGEVDGADWLRCPACGREMFLTINPYSKVIIAEGDNLTSHVYGKGGMAMGEATNIQKED